jgi:hypothetical protein
MMNKTIFLTLTLGLAACGAEQPESKPSGAPPDSLALVRELPGLRILGLDTVQQADSQLRVRRFGFNSAGSEWPFGGGVAVFDARTRELLWIHLLNGNTGAHTIALKDFDGDKRSDVFYYAGQEEDFETTVLLNRVARPSYAFSNFTVGYSDDHSYDPLFDFDGDGRPELLVPEAQDRLSDTDDAPDCEAPMRDGPLAAEVKSEYRRLAGGLDSVNFRYGVEFYPLMNMFMLDRIRILSLATTPFPVTSRFRDHLAWRIRMLERVRPLADETCHRRIDDVLTYLRAQ